MPRKGLFRIGALAVAAAATVVAASGTASASVAPTPVIADAACQALELTKTIDGHDHMFVDPTVDKSDCYYLIVDANNGDTVYNTMSPAGDQPQPDGVYDGPGVRLWVEVDDPGVAHAIGPVN
ncbi:hypothetical protein [Actinacidiphila rubida]|uniref:Uncharacterized protein n=1 Tax=Actinacidiphila rubida TaxID=310780 RepID=A0A1H8NLB3_9ACTN|nr:hypothetical protein [Actinacidiphila rubida]SEO30405.1 hypothetical protein SAMN05216267_1022146 [Actinacidiphila rubida]